MKKLILSLGIVLFAISILLSGCDNLTPKKKTVTNMPAGAELQEAYDALLKKIGITDPEIYEFSCLFNPSLTGKPENNHASMSMTLVNPSDKNKLIDYVYSLTDGTVIGPREVTLSVGRGSNEVFIEKYEEFQDNLFKRDYFPPFSKFDEMYKNAEEKAGYGEECYIRRFGVKIKRDSKEEISLEIKSTKSRTAYKMYYFDKNGNMTGK